MKADFLKGMDVEIEDPWKPIETAPKDARILLGGGEMFCEKSEGWIKGACAAHWCDDYWLVGGAESGYVCLSYDNPTHWMHLPQPPKTDKL